MQNVLRIEQVFSLSTLLCFPHFFENKFLFENKQKTREASLRQRQLAAAKKGNKMSRR